MKTLEQFIGLYPLSKTLRFELLPVGKTAEKFLASGILGRDKQKAENYPAVKKLIDEWHKNLINESLKDKNLKFDWNPLRTAVEEYKNNRNVKNKKRLEEEQKKCARMSLNC